MAASNEWNGFSEDDLQKIRENTEIFTDNSHPDENLSRKLSKMTTTEAKLTSKRVKSKKPRRVPSPSKTDLDPEQMLSPPSKVLTSRAEVNEAHKVKLTGSKSALANGMVTLRVKDDGKAVEIVESEPQTNGIEEKEAVSIGQSSPDFVSCDTIGLNSKKISLEEFQMRQKMIEEQNKRRRAMLTKAIADRKKKTQAETEKLTHIQKELQKLDSLVSNDVSILRNQIEVASVEFNEVQKRYEKAEREFVEAKMELFQKMERKERLTEHLCTIIEDNELRKSKKLAELMHELELESLIQECNEDDSDHVLPQLCALNDITYAYCTTLRQSKLALTSPTIEKGGSFESDSALVESVDLHVESIDSRNKSISSEVRTVSGRDDADGEESVVTAPPFVDVEL